MRRFLFCVLCNVVCLGAAQAGDFTTLISVSQSRLGFAAAIAPGLTTDCLALEWGDNPPAELRDWLTTLLLTDIQNRGRVMRGEMTAPEARKARAEVFFSLELIEPARFEAITDYAGVTGDRGFGPQLTKVMDCQYKGLSTAMKSSQTLG